MTFLLILFLFWLNLFEQHSYVKHLIHEFLGEDSGMGIFWRSIYSRSLTRPKNGNFISDSILFMNLTENFKSFKLYFKN